MSVLNIEYHFVPLCCSFLSKSVILKLDVAFVWRRKFKGYIGTELSFTYLVICEASYLKVLE